MSSEVSAISEIIEDLRDGKMVILVDEEDRENEGDLVVASEHVTPEIINFMARFGRGLICLTLTSDKCRQLNLMPMVSANRSSMGTNFTVSIEAATGVTTGISAADRSRTIKAAVSETAVETDIVQPGHIFPLRAEDGGVLVRAGHTEAGCDLARLAGLQPSSVICEILKDDGEMARLPDLIAFSQQHGIKIGTISDLIAYRSQNESLVDRVLERPIETSSGKFDLIGYRDRVSKEVHLALVKGTLSAEDDVLVRVHEPFSIADLLDKNSSLHSWRFDDALQRINEVGKGVLILLHRTEDGDALLDHLQAVDRSPPKFDLRNYGIGAQILKDLGVVRMRLMAAPRKMPSMAGFDLEIVGYEERAEC
jgi:3,4-dihydroxy 2-butanone 4-phosphate synthase/GTP cyclohydrolase II